jgi:phage-related baseplate assembly protein
MKLMKTSRRYITRFRSDSNLEIQFGAGISTDSDEEIIPNPDNVGNSLTGLQKQFDFPIDPSNFMYTKAYGLAPSNTTLTVTYTTGGGISSNVASYSLTNVVGINFQIDSQTLDTALLNRIKASVACTNPEPATGGKSQESIDEIRENAMAYFAAQQRMVTAQDYVIRTYSMPSRFGAVAKAYVIQDQQLNTDASGTMIPNPLAINLYTLGYDGNNNFTKLNPAVKENLRTYLNSYRMLTDAVNIKDAFIINIGIKFEIITLPEYNSNEVLLFCIDRLKTMFDKNLWQINQPIVISKIYTELDKVEGVQTVTSVKIANLYDSTLGYSSNVYDIAAATKNGVIYPSLDPSIFEIKYLNQDIAGKVVSL